MVISSAFLLAPRSKIRANNFMHTVKVGDKFRLLTKDWMVTDVDGVFNGKYFRANTGSGEVFYWRIQEAHLLDWIKPIPKCSKEFAEALKERTYGLGSDDLIMWINKHTES